LPHRGTDTLSALRAQSELSALDNLRREIGKVIVGQQYLVRAAPARVVVQEPCAVGRRARPWGKTLSITTRRRAVQLSTPHSIHAGPAAGRRHRYAGLRTANRLVSDTQGTHFANLFLADEINRAPAKVQSALLEAMQERQVTMGGRTYSLEGPFLVLATQNPIEQEGTYPLPEAQVDRFIEAERSR
jgi:MoxR-like ATPase